MLYQEQLALFDEIKNNVASTNMLTRTHWSKKALQLDKNLQEKCIPFLFEATMLGECLIADVCFVLIELGEAVFPVVENVVVSEEAKYKRAATFMLGLKADFLSRRVSLLNTIISGDREERSAAAFSVLNLTDCVLENFPKLHQEEAVSIMKLKDLLVEITKMTFAENSDSFYDINVRSKHLLEQLKKKLSSKLDTNNH